jgi:hypothetical protein
MDHEKMLREHLKRVLSWEDAHVNFDTAVESTPSDQLGVRPQGFPYSIWEMVEHIRICQNDILDFCVNSNYKERTMAEFWPKMKMPEAGQWEASIAAFHKDLQALIDLTENTRIDLFGEIPHGQGQTYLREILLVADHNAYHTADIVAIRRALGLWK